MLPLREKITRALQPEPEPEPPPNGGVVVSAPKRRKASHQGDRPRCVTCNRYLPRVLKRYPNETHICRCRG